MKKDRREKSRKRGREKRKIKIEKEIEEKNQEREREKRGTEKVIKYVITTRIGLCKNDDDEEESRSLVQNHANKSFERKLKMCECVFGSFKEGSSFFSSLETEKSRERERIEREKREREERERKEDDRMGQEI